MGLLEKNREPKKYSDEWLKQISDEEFYAEREPVRQAYCRGDKEAERLLSRFDTEEINRLNEKYKNEHPNATPQHREHGWYLSGDD